MKTEIQSTLQDIRHSTGMSQREFAKYYDIPYSTYVKWEQGVSRPSKYVITMLKKTAQVAEGE